VGNCALQKCNINGSSPKILGLPPPLKSTLCTCMGSKVADYKIWRN
jgi:hypothetical protein